MRAPLTKDCPPAGGAAGGRSIALGASAPTSYPSAEVRGKGRESTADSKRPNDTATVTFRAHTGSVWRYAGKRATVLAMLATGQTLTQWDTLPWHTRLGGTIHVFRQDGLLIETMREGPFRHARYRLLTKGCLLSRNVELSRRG